ncbi:hypothetical protein DNHGIG_07390 [Collibacillus ludicampi]|uniref:DUF2935 domain-containing protein n=1 Tax=Collibacillus ludicampi TaxID=2771369 RepID=A0AAV4LBJ9_9BACL|nr:DUF2935 domain-containing protein [Collibacillus ludicampi]GIM45190.1 hypothetical protein DNHGIG_07390 [Collibacillus ludicampi]
MNRDYVSEAAFEHRFWLRVLEDHSRFILDGLSPRENLEIQRAEQFFHLFDSLLSQSQQVSSEEEVIALNEQAHRYVQELREFKLHLIRRHLQGHISFSLPPTFLNHMVNELEEYMRILNSLLSGQIPPSYHAVHHHLLWLPDASGHSDAIAASLDMAEKRMIEKSKTFTKHFDEYYLKAIELASYLRTHLREFPALDRFNKEVEVEILLFNRFLREIEETRLNNQTLGALSPILPDHMLREECYYLTKLSRVTDIKPPDCSPAKSLLDT